MWPLGLQIGALNSKRKPETLNYTLNPKPSTQTTTFRTWQVEHYGKGLEGVTWGVGQGLVHEELSGKYNKSKPSRRKGSVFP